MPIVQARTGAVAYEEQGAGTPLILLHANLGDLHHFDGIIATLAHSYRTIALDWPGYGQSTAPEPPESASAMLLADVLEPAIFLGNSVGGFAAARLAIRCPQRVSALILVDSGGFTTPTLFIKLFCRVKGSELVTRRFATLWAKWYLKRRTPLVKEIIERIDKGRTLPARVAVDAAVWRSFSQPEHDLRAPARQIVAPTLLLYGRYDPAIRFKHDGRNARAAIAHAQHIVLPTGHEPFAEDPEAFLQALEPFLQAVSAQRNFHGTSDSSSAD